jgi:hypothetical protein
VRRPVCVLDFVPPFPILVLDLLCAPGSPAPIFVSLLISIFVLLWILGFVVRGGHRPVSCSSSRSSPPVFNGNRACADLIPPPRWFHNSPLLFQFLVPPRPATFSPFHLYAPGKVPVEASAVGLSFQVPCRSLLKSPSPRSYSHRALPAESKSSKLLFSGVEGTSLFSVVILLFVGILVG